jgi:hypothetical protein
VSVTVGAHGSLTVTDNGHSRTYTLPDGARTFGEARPVWESPDHLLLAVQDNPDRGNYLLRIDVTTGVWEIAANERIFGLTWPWPHRPPGAGPPPLPVPEPAHLVAWNPTGELWSGGTPMAWIQEPPPPAGSAPRVGHITSAGDIVVPRNGRPVTIARTSLPYLDWAVETAVGVLIQGGVLQQTNNRDTRAEFARWDGTVTPFGTDLHSIAISRDGTTAAAHELRSGRRPWSGLHLINLHDATRHTVELPDWDYELRITGVDHQTIWFRSHHQPAETCWTTGHASPVPAPEPPPASGWEGPDAPSHQNYPAASADMHYTVDRSGIRVNGRTFRLPGTGPHPYIPQAAWEDSGHLLINLLGTVFRLDVSTGAYETAATDVAVRVFVQAWPHKHEDRAR